MPRPDSRWTAAAELIAAGPLNLSKRQAVTLSGHVAACWDYVSSEALSAGRDSTILFGDSAPDDEAMAVLNLPVSGVLDGVIQQLILRFLVERAKDPGIMDLLAKWLAAYLGD